MRPRTPKVVSTDTSFSDTILARLDLLREVHGHSCRSLSLLMRDAATGEPRAHNTLGRMLYPSTEDDARAPRLSLVDEVLVALGLPASAVLSPVVGPDDAKLLTWLAEAEDGVRPVADADSVAQDADACLSRLLRQELVSVADGTVTITDSALPLVGRRRRRQRRTAPDSDDSVASSAQ